MATNTETISERLQAQQNAYDNMQDQLKERIATNRISPPRKRRGTRKGR